MKEYMKKQIRDDFYENQCFLSRIDFPQLKGRLPAKDF